MPMFDSDELACQAVVFSFFHALDTRAHEAAAALMAPEGVWMRQGETLLGPGAVLDALNTRPPERTTAHIITNLRLEAKEAGRVQAYFYLTAYETRTDGEAAADIRLLGIRDCCDDLVRLPQGWRILKKQSRRQLPPE